MKSKKLYNKAIKALRALQEIKEHNQMTDLQFESQSVETKRDLYATIDSLKTFIDNID